MVTPSPVVPPVKPTTSLPTPLPAQGTQHSKFLKAGVVRPTIGRIGSESKASIREAERFLEGVYAELGITGAEVQGELLHSMLIYFADNGISTESKCNGEIELTNGVIVDPKVFYSKAGTKIRRILRYFDEQTEFLCRTLEHVPQWGAVRGFDFSKGGYWGFDFADHYPNLPKGARVELSRIKSSAIMATDSEPIADLTISDVQAAAKVEEAAGNHGGQFHKFF